MFLPCHHPSTAEKVVETTEPFCCRRLPSRSLNSVGLFYTKACMGEIVCFLFCPIRFWGLFLVVLFWPHLKDNRYFLILFVNCFEVVRPLQGLFYPRLSFLFCFFGMFFFFFFFVLVLFKAHPFRPPLISLSWFQPIDLASRNMSKLTNRCRFT